MDNKREQTIGRMFRHARKARHLSQRELAQLSGIKDTTISKIERDRWNVTVGLLQRLLEVMDYRLDIVDGRE